MSEHALFHRLNRRSFLAGLTGAAATLIVACAPPPPPTPTPAPAPAKPAAAAPAPTTAPAAKQPIEIKFHFRTGDRDDAWEVTLKDLKEKYPHITLKSETVPAAEYYDKIPILAAGGTLGDLAFGIPPTYHETSLAGFWKQMDPFILASKYDMSKYFEKGALSHMRVEGKFYGLPFKGSPGTPGLYYNTQMLAKEGIDIDKVKSFDELVGVAKQLTKTSGGQTDVWGFTYVGHDGSSFVNWTRYWGVEPVEPVFQATKALLDQPKQMEALTWLWRLIWEHKVCPLPGPGAQAYDQLFIAQKNAMTQQGTWARGYAVNIKDAFKLGVRIMPPGPGGQVGLAHYYDFFGMNGKAKYPDDAWPILTYFCGPDHGTRIGLPGPGSWTPGGRQDVYDAVSAKEETIRPFAAIIKDSGPVYWTKNYRTQKTVTTIKQSFDKLILNSTLPKAADFKEVNDILQGVLDEK